MRPNLSQNDPILIPKSSQNDLEVIPKSPQELSENEFDIYRKEKKAHPLMQKHNLNCIPYEHEKLPEWRNAFKGIQWHDKETNFLFRVI